ncbi:MAG: hypothetical protein ACM3U1_02760 [Chloroflexota bacterium]
MRFKGLLRGLAVALISVLVFNGCSALKDVSKTIGNLQKLKFKLDNVSGFRLAGVNLSNKSRLSDISVSDALNLTRAFGSKRLPAEFTLNVAALNPAESGGATQPTKSSASGARLVGLDWRLFIDNVETVSGDISSPVTIPNAGEQTIIPIRINLDLMSFFGNQDYERLINLALALGGQGGSAARLKLDARPTISTSFGNFTYPNRITIVNTEFR